MEHERTQQETVEDSILKYHDGTTALLVVFPSRLETVEGSMPRTRGS